MSSKCLTCNVVINELLTFIRNAVDFMDEERIIELCTSNYTPGEIVNAKHVIHEFMPDAKNLLQGDNYISRDLYNIIWLIKNGDRKKLPIFAAVVLKRIVVWNGDGTTLKDPTSETVSTKQDTSNTRASFDNLMASSSSKKTLQIRQMKQTTPVTLLTLPLEILAVIFQKLDTKSIYNLYNTCAYFQNLVSLRGVVKRCTFSVNSLATAKSLKSAFFRDISDSLKVINLSGVSDLYLSSLLKALQNLKNLVDLDVSYTKIIMPYFLEIVKVRPTLKSIAINFSFGNENPSDVELLSKYQQAFKEYEKVHFVSDPESFNAGLAVCMLQKAGPLNFKLTCSGYPDNGSFDWGYFNFNKNQTIPNFSQFQFYLCKDNNISYFLKFPIFPLMDLKKYEIVIFGFGNYDNQTIKIIATALLQKIIENFTVDVECLSDGPPSFTDLEAKLKILDPYFRDEIVIIFYDKEHTNFDKKFNSNLLTIIKEYFVFNFDCSALTKVPLKYKWYKTNYRTPPSYEFDYDVAFEDMKDIKLHVTLISNTMPVIHNFEYLKNLSHLTLNSGYYNSDFLEKLLKHCVSLVTLQLMGRDLGITDIFNYQWESKSLKNILIQGGRILFSSVLSTLSKCQTLENIFLISSYKYIDKLPNPSKLFKGCPNLYNLHIRSLMCSEELLEESRTLYENVKSDLGRSALNIDIGREPGDYKYNFTPHLRVFDVFQLKPVF